MIFETQLHSLQNAVAKFTEPVYQHPRIPVANETKSRWKQTAKAAAKPKSDLEEMKEALEEYETTKGDWSKSH